MICNIYTHTHVTHTHVSTVKFQVEFERTAGTAFEILKFEKLTDERLMGAVGLHEQGNASPFLSFGRSHPPTQF